MGQRPLWLIDLDNTLYDASWRVMGEINRRMTHYVAQHLELPLEEASRLREHYWQRYGATLLGLVRHHNIDPHHFLSATHPVDDLPHFVRRLRGEPHRLRKLKGEKWLLTNAPRAYAKEVLHRIGLRHLFDHFITVEDMRVGGRLCPKPSQRMMRAVLRRSGYRPGRVILVDDHNENLRSAHRLGIRTARIWASGTALQRARSAGRPLTVRRPAYVRVQVNSLAELLRSQHRLTRRQL